MRGTKLGGHREALFNIPAREAGTDQAGLTLT